MPAEVRQTTATFHVIPPALKPGHAEITAVVEFQGKSYSEGFAWMKNLDIDNAVPYFQPARQRIRILDVKIPKDLKIGYFMGAGDEIGAVLRQAGASVEFIEDHELYADDLSRYGTIVVGVRAYDTSDNLRKCNSRLLDYVKNGGTLVVQYNSGVADFNAGHFTPYPAELSRERVSVEEAPVQILSAQNPIFHYPNEITAADFDGWVQERGLYFMGQWDAQFEPLLESHDPGEPPRKGGLLEAHYGKGLYLYTGYSFFRELPAGVPGAVRLFVNLVSAGHGN
jgi:hypothetical protein